MSTLRYFGSMVLGATLFCTLLQPQSAEELFRQGGQFFAEHNWDAAIAAFQRSVEIRPDYAPAWKALGVVFASRGDYEHAEPAFRNACDRQPSLEDACLYFGRALYLLDRFPPAIGALHRALKTRDGAEAHRLLALSLEALDRPSEAEPEFKTAIRLARNTPPDEDPGIDYGVFLYRQARTEEALEPLRAALQRHPDSARAHLELGCVLLELDRLDDAAAHLERSLALHPDSPRARLLLGKVKARLGRQ